MKNAPGTQSHLVKPSRGESGGEGAEHAGRDTEAHGTVDC
jgi:hypothetical protein